MRCTPLLLLLVLSGLSRALQARTTRYAHRTPMHPPHRTPDASTPMHPPEARGGDVRSLADEQSAGDSALGVVGGGGGLRGAGWGRQARNAER